MVYDIVKFNFATLDVLMKNTRALVIATLLTLAAPCSSAFADHSNAQAWLKPTSDAWKVTPLLNVGDAVGAKNYRMVGIPDGLGALDNGDGTLSIYMNHEIGKDQGKNRKHFGRGAFVSHWKLDIASLKIIDGEDLIKQTKLWLADDKKHVNAPAYSFNRLCAADLPALSAFYDAASGKGFNGRLFMNGEEDREGGRGFAHVVTGEQKGISYELPYLGKFAWENAVANPSTGVKTVVMGMDDSPGGQVYMYVGEKRAAGNPVEQAGLMGGNLYAVKVDDKRFSFANLGDVSAMSGDDLEKAGRAVNVANFMRPEDGVWDLNNPNVFYFATTDKIDGTSQLFQLTFEDIAQPEKGGAIKVVLNARDIGAQMFDNITVTGDGKVLVEEDPGDNPHMAAIWLFDPKTGKAEKVLRVAPEVFLDKNSPAFLTQDEENSGIIEVTELVRKAPWFEVSKRYFLGALQVHAKSSDPELVEGGQLYLITGPSGQ
jgi:hypothetical protein